MMQIKYVCSLVVASGLSVVIELPQLQFSLQHIIDLSIIANPFILCSMHSP